MRWEPDELWRLWDWPLAAPQAALAEALAWIELDDVAPLTPDGRAFARTPPSAVAGVDQPAAAGSVMGTWGPRTP